MTAVVLTTLNAKYIHSSFGLRYLYANLGELQNSAEILEFNINQRPIDIAETILAKKPRIIGFGVYIWNAAQTLQVVKLIKQIDPELIIIVGGPEVSFEWDRQEIVKFSDYCITGEADLTLKPLIRELLQGQRPEKKVIFSKLPETSELALPYHHYDDNDIRSRVIYVEASRGCPFTCEFCLSSLDVPVRQFDLDLFLAEMEKLYRRGARRFKFVDRTFNLNLRTSQRILQFFLDNYVDGLFVHFEMIPDRLPEGLRDIIRKFPAGALQFEVGIQSFNPEVNKLISRRQNFEKIRENIGFLRRETGVHIHADLIAGLPGENIESFADGFNTLYEYGPQEIQVGILKRLRGTPIIRHDEEWQMRYNPDPPYEILSNKLISFHDMQRISRFSRYWDLFGNSGHFLNTLPLLWSDSGEVFQNFMRFSDWIYSQAGKRHEISLERQRGYLENYLESEKRVASQLIAESSKQDQLIHAARVRSKRAARQDAAIPERQARHLNLLQGNA